MKALSFILLVAAPAFAAELAPNGTLRFEFPDLPPTLVTMTGGAPQPATLTARLPDNYSDDRQFPLFLYLLGGTGGRGDEGNLQFGLKIIGPRDFIVVTLPLFKKKLDVKERHNGLMVAMDDFETIARSYRVMLEKLFAAVPNITAERSTLGGFSNGAHTTGVLLAGQDEFTLAHFRQFYLMEGGVGPLLANVLQKTAMKTPRLFVMTGGLGYGPELQKPLPYLAMQRVLEDTAAREKDPRFTFVTMHGYGHEQPPEYLNLIGQWARGAPVDDVPAKRKALAAALTLPLRAHPDTGGWPEMLNPDLSNVQFEGGAWSQRDGVLRATKREPLWTRSAIGDCLLDLEFRCQPGAAGGVFLYNSDAKNWPATSVQIRIGDDAAAGNERTGTYLGHQPATRGAAKPAGAWNRLTITAQGSRLAVVLNGEIVNDIDLARFVDAAKNPDGSPIPEPLRGQPWSLLPKKGRIGFDAGEPGGGVEFRRIHLLPL
jgi:hypothetical protein